MTGWNLKKGELINCDEDLLPIVSNALICQLYKTTTYKYCFFISLLNVNCQIKNNFVIDFDEIIPLFSKAYWDLINVFKIPQKYISSADFGSSVEIIIKKIVNKYPESESVYFDSLNSKISNLVIKEIKKVFKSYVVGAFYAETLGYLFGFDKSTEKIYLNIKSHNFLLENKLLLEQLCYFQWLKMCESILDKRGEHRPNLSLTIENITKRHSLENYKKQFNALNIEDSCFYCGKEHTKKFALDHVIPWKFLKDDNLWNLVWVCPKCNSSKSNRLPDKFFIDKLVKRNASFCIKSPDINHIYEIAKKNGFVSWKKK